MTLIFTATPNLKLTVDNPTDGLHCDITCLSGSTDGITEVQIQFFAERAVVPNQTTISWQEPMKEIHYKWNPLCFENRFLDTSHSFNSKANSGAPVMCLYRQDGQNTLTFALSDALHETRFGVRVGEEGFATCSVVLFVEPWKPITEYNAILRIDRRSLPYYSCLRSCGQWWDQLIPGERISVPEAAKTARYCTWYPFHGKFTGEETERQCKLAKELGIGSFAYEAGWADDNLDYQPDAKKYADFRQHVDAIHSHGMQFILWVAPCFANPVSAERFHDRLHPDPRALNKSGLLDPRYPDIRSYIIETYERLLCDYGIDGLFLDFLATFLTQAADEPEDDRRDYKSVPEAVDALIRDLTEALRRINPDLLMEYRQPYVGPHIRKHANMIRAVDCGNCFADNHVRSLDIRLLCGDAVAVSDPIMWNPDEPVESAAMQLTHTLFCVPQISMNLDKLSTDHIEMIRTYISFWNEHRDVIMGGELMPFSPQRAYPLVLSQTAHKFLAAAFDTTLIPLPKQVQETVLLVNGTYEKQLILDVAGNMGTCDLLVTSCTGVEVCHKQLQLGVGLHRIDVPSNGFVRVDRREDEVEYVFV